MVSTVAGRYVWGYDNSTDCPANSARITEYAECRSAAAAAGVEFVGMRSPRDVFPPPYIPFMPIFKRNPLGEREQTPRGCFLQAGARLVPEDGGHNVNRVFFGAGTVGCAQTGAKLLCSGTPFPALYTA